MAIDPGTRFGPYEIVEAIGAGGMGEVYRATDTTLERDVAIKVLPASFAEDAGRVERFDREAKTLASLNHPNIAQIYGLEKSDGTTALVMELVEGPTLEDRIAKGPIPTDEALGIAMQIADALEAAHGQNIVHRDLKPANIKLKTDGTVKVLDFGIAKALAPENLTSDPHSPIMTTPATQVGMILGTAAYMSPEQAKGKAVDQRTDIWAFGCVLYEMLTGQLAFGAEDVPTTLARVIANDTNLDSLPASISPAVRHTINLCLRKDTRRRVADIRDVKLALEGDFESDLPETGTTVTVAQPFWRRALPLAGAVVAAVIITAFAVRAAMQPEPRPINRFDEELAAGESLRFPAWNMLAFSRDGRSIVYNTTSGLYLRTLGELEARLIPGTEENIAGPVFSPDGRAIAYYTDNHLKRISIDGGAPIELSDRPSGCGVSWETAEWILDCQGDGVLRIPANGGASELVMPRVEREGIESPRLLPDGDSVIFSRTDTGSFDNAQIVVQSISTGERSVLISGGADARYLPSGHLIYAFQDSLFAVAFDLDTLTVSGRAVPMAQGVVRSPSAAPTYSANYGVSDDGTLVYLSGSLIADARILVWVDRDGREEPIDALPRSYFYPRISPDSTKVALDVRDQDLDIWIWDLARETLTRLTFDPGQDEFPVWSPDSRRIALSSSRETGSGGGDTDLFWQAADGTGAAELLAASDGQIFPTAFLPDGTGILVRIGDNMGNSDDIGIVYLGEEGPPTPLLASAFNERNPEISPDGRWLAYVSAESGNEEIYVRPFPDVDAGRWQVSTGGGIQPLWAPDGHELYYRDGAAVMAVSVETSPTFVASRPALLFEDRYAITGNGRSYDISPDGERFLMIKAVADTSAAPKIIIIENWVEELQRLVPTE